MSCLFWLQGPPHPVSSCSLLPSSPDDGGDDSDIHISDRLLCTWKKVGARSLGVTSSPFSQDKFLRSWRERLSCPSAFPVSRGMVVQSPSTRHMHIEWLSLQACSALANITMTYFLSTGLYLQMYACFLSHTRLSVDLNPCCVFRQHLDRMPGTLLYWRVPLPLLDILCTSSLLTALRILSFKLPF